MKPELMIPVEIAVRGIPCSHQRKMRIREELYALIEDRHAELARSGLSEEAALHAACEAFGDPRQIREELLASLPLWERWRRPVILILGGCFPRNRPLTIAESLRFSTRCSLAWITCFLMLGVVVSALKSGRHLAEFWSLWSLWLGFALFAAVNTSAAIWLGSHAVQGMVSEEKTKRNATWLILGGLGFGLAMWLSTLMLYMTLEMPGLNWARMLAFVPATQGIFSLVVHAMAHERRVELPWVELQLPSD